MSDTRGKVVLSRNAMEEILRLATLNVYGVTGLAPVTFAERFTRALAIPSTPKGVDAQIRKDGTHRGDYSRSAPVWSSRFRSRPYHYISGSLRLLQHDWDRRRTGSS